MKINRSLPLCAILALAAFPVTGCAEKAQPAESAPPPPAKEPAPVADTAPAVPFVRWSEIKGYTYDQRDLFLESLKGLEARVDAQISELTAKRAAMAAANTSTKDWDLTMPEMITARTNLKSTSDDMTSASRETWDQQKDKVGLAWVRTQDAYARVKSSTTN